MVTLHHVWFSTKGRRPVLENPDIRDLALRLLTDAAFRHNIQLPEIVLDADHVHLLLELEDHMSLANAVRLLKGSTSRHLFLAVPELKVDMPVLWQKGYGSRQLGARELPVVRNYIRTHNDRPLRHD